MKQYTGACFCCGQVQMISAEEGLSESEVGKRVALQCNCDGGRELQKIEQKKTSAEANIKSLFKDENESFKKILLSTVESLANQSLKKVNFSTNEGIKASLTAKENSIKVERIETKKSSLED